MKTRWRVVRSVPLVCASAVWAGESGIHAGGTGHNLSRGDTLMVGEFGALAPVDPDGGEAPAANDEVLSGWKPLAFGGERGETRYTPGRVEDRACLRADADAGGSGLLKLLEDTADPPSLIRWSWWVPGPVPGGDLTRKEGDDFAARVYVNFRFEPERAGIMHRLKQRLAGRRFGGEAPGKALVYVWGNRARVGTVAPNAYTDQAMVVVVKSGRDHAGRWWTEERDLDRDFVEAFGHEPPPLHSIAIMTDADDTAGEAAACYGDILLF